MHARGDRIRKTLMKELSDILRKNVKDPRISEVVSITDIDLSADFSVAKVFISVYGSEAEQEQTLEAISENISRIRHEVGKRVRLRVTPELRFSLDDSLERGTRITHLIDKISKGEL